MSDIESRRGSRKRNGSVSIFDISIYRLLHAVFSLLDDKKYPLLFCMQSRGYSLKN